MSHLFVKKGVMTSDVAKQVKVNFAPGGVNKLAEEKKKSRRLRKKRSGWRGNHKWLGECTIFRWGRWTRKKSWRSI